MEYKVKVVVGFRKDQEFSIDAQEAHKVYYLFLNPEQRGVFNNGLALKGSQIQEIVPDFHGTMGWNPSHVIDGDDWNQLRLTGVDRRMREILFAAKTIGARGNPEDLSTPLPELLGTTYEHLLDAHNKSGNTLPSGERHE